MKEFIGIILITSIFVLSIIPFRPGYENTGIFMAIAIVLFYDVMKDHL